MRSFTGDAFGARSDRGLRFVVTLALAGGCFVTACTAATQDNFQNPPAGPPASCSLAPAMTGCTAGAVAYSCAGGRPDDGDGAIVCDDGTPGDGGADAGSTLYCCAPYAQWATECTPRTTIAGCGAQSIGFSCAGGTAPDEADTAIVCSGAIESAEGAHDYCCVPFDQANAVCRCASFDPTSKLCGLSPTGCAGSAVAFACAAGHTPSEINPLLGCAQPDGGGAGNTFCCEAP
jgi:hypothetical protein